MLKFKHRDLLVQRHILAELISLGLLLFFLFFRWALTVRQFYLITADDTLDWVLIHVLGFTWHYIDLSAQALAVMLYELASTHLINYTLP